MYEFDIKHKHCEMTKIIFGYNFEDACRRAKIDANIWIIIDQEYID